MKACLKRIALAMLLLTLAGAMNQMQFNRVYRATVIDARVGVPTATPTLNLLLGGFRGVVADWLWLRAMFLQEQGRFVEIVQLAEWITALQPQFADIWSLHAWNLAYNITVLLPDGQERWRWVRHGYEILRDQAIPATQFHPRICTELAWILMHKIAGTSDDFADVYFLNWLDLYTPILSHGNELPAAPDPNYEAFRKESGLPTTILQKFEESFGPHDWRHPLTHAAAWAYTGFKLHPETNGAILAERLFLQTYRQLFLQGLITEDPNTSNIVLRPDYDRMRGLRKIMTDMQARGTQHDMPEVHLATLEHMVQMLVAKGRQQEAQNIYAELVRAFPDSSAAHRGYHALTAQPVIISPRFIPRTEPRP